MQMKLKRLLTIGALVMAWVVLVVISAAAGWIAMLLSASFTADLILFSVLSVLAVACVALAGSWLMGWTFRFGRGWRWANALLLTVGLTAAAKLMLFLPAHELYGPLQAPEITATPAQASFWQLPTGSRIAYQRFAAEQGEPKATILWLHGGPGAYAVSMSELHPIFEELAGMGYEVYIYDQIGGGLSARLADLRDYTLDRHLRDLQAIQLHIDAPSVVLIGSSWGAALAAHYIARNPGSVHAAVFNAPGEMTTLQKRSDAEGSGTQSREDNQAKREWTLALGPRALILEPIRLRQPALFDQLSSDAEWDQAMDYFLNRFVLADAVCPGTSIPLQVRGYGLFSNKYTNIDFLQSADETLRDWPGTDIPTLLLRGECEFLSEEIVEQYRGRFTQLQFVEVVDAGHFIALEQPAVLIEQLRLFLDKNATMTPITNHP